SPLLPPARRRLRPPAKPPLHPPAKLRLRPLAKLRLHPPARRPPRKLPQPRRDAMRAVVLERIGGPEQLSLREVPDPEPGPGEAVVRIAAAGVCGRDLIDRRGGFPAMKLPTVLGHEFSGEVIAVGPGTTRVSVG